MVVVKTDSDKNRLYMHTQKVGRHADSWIDGYIDTAAAVVVGCRMVTIPVLSDHFDQFLKGGTRTGTHAGAFGEKQNRSAEGRRGEATG